SQNLERRTENSEPKNREPRTENREPPASAKRKLSYKEQRELASLPAHIEALEAEQRALNERIASQDFYKESADAIRDALARVDTLQKELNDAYTRWNDLES